MEAHDLRSSSLKSLEFLRKYVNPAAPDSITQVSRETGIFAHEHPLEGRKVDNVSTIRVYLGNPRNMGLNWQQVEDLTWLLFEKSNRKTKKIDKVIVKMVTAKPALQPNDVLVYMCPSHAKGIIGQKFGSKKKKENQYGLTQWEDSSEGNSVGAEVYVRDLKERPYQIAKFIWHETLHAKLKVEDEMHSRGGLAKGEIGEDTKLTERNAKDMAQALQKHRNFWTGGFDHDYGSGKFDHNDDSMP